MTCIGKTFWSFKVLHPGRLSYKQLPRLTNIRQGWQTFHRVKEKSFMALKRGGSIIKGVSPYKRTWIRIWTHQWEMDRTQIVPFVSKQAIGQLQWRGATTICWTTLGITTFGKIKLSIMSLSMATLSMMTLGTMTIGKTLLDYRH